MPVPGADKHQPAVGRQCCCVIRRPPALLPKCLTSSDVERLKLTESVWGIWMEVILASADAAGSTAAFPSLDWSKRGRLAVQVEWNIEGPCIGVVGHRPQTLEAARARAEKEFFANIDDHTVSICHLSGLHVQVEDVLVAKIDAVHILAGYPIEFP